MNHSTRVMRRPRRAARTAAAIIATAALALLATACSASPSSTGSGRATNAGGSANSPSANSQKALAFSRCVRSRGVPNYPDPDSSGGIAKETAQQLGVSSSQLQAIASFLKYPAPGLEGSPKLQLPSISNMVW